MPQQQCCHPFRNSVKNLLRDFAILLHITCIFDREFKQFMGFNNLIVIPTAQLFHLNTNNIHLNTFDMKWRQKHCRLNMNT